MTEYTADLIGPDDSVIHTFTQPANVEWARTLNTVGSITLSSKLDFDFSVIRPHTRLVAYRNLPSGVADKAGDTVWFINKFSYRRRSGIISLFASDAMTLLDRRAVAYTPQTTYADKTLEEFGLITYDDTLRLDNMMRAYVRENIGSSALDASRIADWIEVEGDRNIGPYGEKQAGFQNLLSTLQDLARQSADQGTDLYFDLIPREYGKFVFRVWQSYRNMDHGSNSVSPLVFSEENGNLGDVEIEYNYENLGNACYATGSDHGAAMVYALVENKASQRISRYGRIEFVHNAGDSDNPSVVALLGSEALYARRARRFVRGSAIDIDDCVFGVNYKFGDQVSVEADGVTFDALVKSVRSRWSEGKEAVSIQFEGVQSL